MVMMKARGEEGMEEERGSKGWANGQGIGENEGSKGIGGRRLGFTFWLHLLYERSEKING
jgi:hypothetical protein